MSKKRNTKYLLSSLLRSIVSASDISKAKQSHVQALVHGVLSDDVTLQTDLLRAYTKCGLVSHARNVFDKMPHRPMHSWNILIFSYVHFSMYSLAFGVFDHLRNTGFRPDHYTLPPLFKASLAFKRSFFGTSLYALSIKLGLHTFLAVGTSFLDLCLKCGSVVDARRVFSEMPTRDNIAWNSMISGLARAGFRREALSCFREMIRASVDVDSMTIPSVLNACGGEGDFIKGKQIHGQVSKVSLFKSDIAIGNSLIDMYAKCGCLNYAEKVFEIMTEKNLVTWTTMISCYGLHGRADNSLLLYEKMRDYGFQPNCVTLTAILASFSHSGLIKEARRVFDSIESVYGFEPRVEHYACMVDLLGRFGYLEEALGLATKIESKAPASVWGALLAGCTMHKNLEIGEIAAYKLFELEPKNSSNYVALCSIYESLSMWNRLSMVRSRMRELGLVKTPGCSWITVSGIVYKFFQADRSHPLALLLYETLDGLTKEASLANSCSSEGLLYVI